MPRWGLTGWGAAPRRVLLDDPAGAIAGRVGQAVITGLALVLGTAAPVAVAARRQ